MNSPIREARSSRRRFFGAISIFIGVAVAINLKRLAAPADEPSYYGTTSRARRLIGGTVALGLLAIFWYQVWGGFYMTIAGSTVELSYRGSQDGSSSKEQLALRRTIPHAFPASAVAGH